MGQQLTQSSSFFRRLFLVLFLFFKAFAFSTTYIWVNPLSSTWNTNANWTPNTGFPNAVADAAVFGNVITGNRVVTLGVPVTVNRIGFDSSFGYTLSGSSLTLQASSGNALIGLTHVNGNGVATISSNCILNSPLTISHDTTSNFTISGVISGNQSLTKTGSGVNTTILSGANTYSGGTFLDQGTLQISNNGNLGTSDLTFIGNSTLNLMTGPTITKNITLNSGAIGVISSNMAATLSGQITGSGNIGITNGTIAFTNTTNNYTGNTIFGASVSGTGGNGILVISDPLQLGATSGIVAWGGSVGTLNIKNTMTIANVPLRLTGALLHN